MYLERHLAIPLRRAVHLNEPVLLQGPRGAGKTTLLRREFPNHLYIDLALPADRARARRDPRGFLARLRAPSIIDEAHRAPELLSLFETDPPPQPLILASSLRLRLAIETLELQPPTHAERQRRPALPLEILGRFAPSKPSSAAELPAFPLPGPSPADIHSLVSVHDLDRFHEFLAFARQRTACVLDQQALAREAAISHRTAVRWLQVLDTCFLTLRLPPLDNAFGRRLVRRPILHFLDSPEFASHAVAEVYRNAVHNGPQPQLRYWRDSNGFEIPLILDDGVRLVPFGITTNPNPAVESALRRWMQLASCAEAAILTRHPGPPGRREGRLLRYGITQL